MLNLPENYNKMSHELKKKLAPQNAQEPNSEENASEHSNYEDPILHWKLESIKSKMFLGIISLQLLLIHCLLETNNFTKISPLL